MTRFHKIAATAVVALGASLSLGAVAAHASTGSQLTTDVAGAVQSGEHATANDQSSAAEENVDDGQVENIDEGEVDETGDHQTGEAANDQSTVSTGDTGATTSGQTGPDGESK